MSVYLSFMEPNEDFDGTLDDGPTRLPDSNPEWEGPIPRVGEFVFSGNSRTWWKVVTIAYSNLRPAYVSGGTFAWVDVSVREHDGDPR